MIAIIICVAGIILYLATDGKPSRVGEIMIWAGAFGIVWFFGGKAIW